MWHHRVEIPVIGGSTQHRRLDRITRLDGDGVTIARFDSLQEVIRVEADRDIRTLVVGVEFFDGLAGVIGVHGQLKRTRGLCKPNGNGVAGKQLGTAHCIEQGFAIDGELVGVRRLDQLLVVGKLHGQQ